MHVHVHHVGDFRCCDDCVRQKTKFETEGMRYGLSANGEGDGGWGGGGGRGGEGEREREE